MGSQIQIQKIFQNTDFFTTSIYELNDLRGVISPNERFVIRQGDLIVTNRIITRYTERGLSKAYLKDMGRYLIFRESHIILPANENTIIFHNEHGLLILPSRFENLYFYTFRDAYD